MKKCGVPAALKSVAKSMSASISAAWVLLVIAFLTRFSSSFSSLPSSSKSLSSSLPSNKRRFASKKPASPFCARVKRQWILTQHDAHILRIARHELVHGRLRAPTIRTLIVEELDDRDQRVARTDAGRALHGDLPDHQILLGFVFGIRLGCHVVGGNAGLVEVRGWRALAREFGGSGELGVDDAHEGLDGLCAAQRLAVDAKRGRAIGTDLVGERDVSLDFVVRFRQFCAAQHDCWVEPNARDPRVERLVPELQLLLEGEVQERIEG